MLTASGLFDLGVYFLKNMRYKNAESNWNNEFSDNNPGSHFQLNHDVRSRRLNNERKDDSTW